MSAKTIKILTMIYGYRHDACALYLPKLLEEGKGDEHRSYWHRCKTEFRRIHNIVSSGGYNSMLDFATAGIYNKETPFC